MVEIVIKLIQDLACFLINNRLSETGGHSGDNTNEEASDPNDRR